jgi:hypothetical protein
MINEKLKTLLECYLSLSEDQNNLARSMSNLALSSQDFERKKNDFNSLTIKKKNIVALIGDQLEKMTKLEK